MHHRCSVKNHRVCYRENRFEIDLIHSFSILSIVMIHESTLFFLTKSAEPCQPFFSLTMCTTAIAKKITAYATAKTAFGLIPFILHTVLSSIIIYVLSLSYLTKSAECFAALAFSIEVLFIHTIYIRSIF